MMERTRRSRALAFGIVVASAALTTHALAQSATDCIEDGGRAVCTSRYPTPLTYGLCDETAPFVWRRDGRPDWGAMWTTFCELALYGGPPQRGAESALRGADGACGPVASPSPEMLTELQRGVLETTGLAAEPAEPGWIAVLCESRRMAAWLCAAIIVENVDARVDGRRLLLPAGADFVLEDEVRSVITVVAKTHHYWREHVTRSSRG